MVGKKRNHSTRKREEDRENCMHAMGIDGNAWNNQVFEKHNTQTYNGCYTHEHTLTYSLSDAQLSVVESVETYSKNHKNSHSH